FLAGRLEQAGVSPEQVQVAWIKQARAGPSTLGEFPRHAQALKENLAVIVRGLRERYPNLQITYVSSRIYAGYANTQLNPEPYAYEGAYSVRWLVQDQIDGKGDLNADAAKGPVRAPVLLWGPYLWADGTHARADNQLAWQADDFSNDGTHPNAAGQM